jgi:hypothetical protein
VKQKWLKKIIHNAREVNLTAREKRVMLSRILGKGSIPSPYSFMLTVMEYRRRIVAAVVVVAIITASGGTSLAATGALPGEALYAVKVNVNEEIQNLVAVGPDAKAKVGVQHATNRLSEAESLSKQGKFDAKAHALIENDIEKQTQKVKENVAVLASENATATAKEVITDLKTALDAHEVTLAGLASSTASTTSDSDDHIDALIHKVNKVKSEMEVIEKDIEDQGSSSTDSSSATSTPGTTGSSAGVATSTSATSTSSKPGTTSTSSVSVKDADIL